MTSDDATLVLEPALDELERELNVRMRCFDKWISEGRMSGTDARDRVSRLMGAILIIKRCAAYDPSAFTMPSQVTSSGDLSESAADE